MRVPIGAMNDWIVIERPVADDSFTGAGIGTWVPLDEGCWAEVQDSLPSRAERMEGGFTVSARRARVRMRFREDITPAMRFVMGARAMQIISGPAELGRQDGLEFMVEDFTSAGNAA